ncbi:MAG: sensor domain-containing diguanylate cyclase [Thermaerobacter sp.]|nr:sensor domain-containing diguanylate cyclase [Thermaerobacter sp.]
MRTVPERGTGPRSQGMWTTFRFDLLGLLVLVLVLTATPLPPIAYLPLLDVIVMGVGIAFGRRMSVLFAAVAIIAELIRVHLGFDLTGLLVLVTPLISGLAGGYTGQRLRETHLASERAARRAELLSVAMMRLPALDSTRAIYGELPRLLSEILGFTHADVLAPSPDGAHLVVVTSFGWTPPDEIRVPLRSVTGRAFLQGAMQHVSNVAEDPDFFEGPGLGPIHGELALPIFADGSVVAVLNLERAQSGLFAPEEIASLQALVQAVGTAVERAERLARAHEMAHSQDFLLDFSRQIADAGPPESLARRALTLLLPRLGADAGRLWQPNGRDLRVIAELSSGDSPPAGTLLAAQVPDEPLFVSDSTSSPYTSAEQLSAGLQSFALLPMFEADGRLHALLEILYYQQSFSFPHAQRQTLQRATERLSEALQQTWITTRLSSLLDALHGLGSVGDAARLPDLALATALHLIPGTDAASLLLSEEGSLRLAAQLGYGDAGASHWHLHTLEEAQSWYGGETWQFLRGTPRLLEGVQVSADNSGVRCSLCLPLVHEGQLIGLLSLDSLMRPDAFSRVSVSLAETFGMQLSVLLEQLRHRRTLERVARTDALTGLANRRSFDERLTEEWQAAQRYGHPLSLVIIDLLGFKSVNDRNGHQAGDQALVAVARAMEEVRRDGDTIFRWGGDEFAIILTHADLPGAQTAAARYLSAIQSARVHAADGTELRVSATLGVASAPRDADNVQALIKAADDYVFEAKRAKVPIAPPPED